jgi:hypothetical protein
MTERSTIFFAKANDGLNDKIEPSAVEDHGGILAIRAGGAPRLERHSLQATGMINDHLVTCPR